MQWQSVWDEYKPSVTWGAVGFCVSVPLSFPSLPPLSASSLVAEGGFSFVYRVSHVSGEYAPKQIILQSPEIERDAERERTLHESYCAEHPNLLPLVSSTRPPPGCPTRCCSFSSTRARSCRCSARPLPPGRAVAPAHLPRLRLPTHPDDEKVVYIVGIANVFLVVVKR